MLLFLQFYINFIHLILRVTYHAYKASQQIWSVLNFFVAMLTDRINAAVNYTSQITDRWSSTYCYHCPSLL